MSDIKWIDKKKILIRLLNHLWHLVNMIFEGSDFIKDMSIFDEGLFKCGVYYNSQVLFFSKNAKLEIQVLNGL